MQQYKAVRPGAWCPCGSGMRYEDCCQGHVPEKSLALPAEQVGPEYLSVRGKNMRFLRIIGEALDLDPVSAGLDWKQVKRAFTPQVVRRLHESVAELWPNSQDLDRALHLEKRGSTGLFTGRYDDPEALLRAVARHGLYSESILLVDPFTDPRTVRDSFNPLLHPEQFSISTLMSLRLWLSLARWIDAGVVKFIRSPGQFDIALQLECNSIEERRYSQAPALMATLERDNPDPSPHINDCLQLMVPDDALVRRFTSCRDHTSEAEVQNLLQKTRDRRLANPYFVATFDSAEWGAEQIIVWSTGASYEMARLASLLTDSHLLTDLPSRWEEIRMVREESEAQESVWGPFADAFSAVDIKLLDHVPLERILELRPGDKLSEMRAFLADVWKKSGGSKEADERQVLALTHELHERMRRARAELTEIGASLASRIGDDLAEAAENLPAALADGQARWLGVGTALRLGGRLVGSWIRRRDLTNSCPAAFLLSLRK